ncbi:flagellar protein FlbD [Natranaerovirga hydrolytica]|uniref:Flagellar protein FlbD n=1 Tax=Natranaerovirga hydrolytica TaxID=680378 RepID=A0A4R1MXB6_9FIRM|nr:flagellar FlbD family protein [Natranaerovirga hydrolytica]TCK97897.1 flagellar protein FlbD [Natranaerovirga hydrolytica]
MIEVTKINNVKIIINAELIESIEETPDTLITLTTGKKIVVKEEVKKVIHLAIAYKKKIHSSQFEIRD